MAITRRRLMAGMAILPTAAILPRFALSSKPTQPNIILFVADDMRFDAAGYMGNKIIKTPAIDALSKSSFIFDNTFVTTSICPTSRASIYSGEYCLKHGVADFKRAMNGISMENAFFNHLRDAGYYTGFIGKWGIGGAMPENKFNKWYGFSGQGSYYEKKDPEHLTDRQTRHAIEFIKGRPKNKPFLLVVAYKAPHAPYDIQKRFTGLYADPDNAILKYPVGRDEYIAHLPPLLRRGFEPEDDTAIAEQDRDKRARDYYRLITGLDESLGKVLETADKEGISDDTSVIFTSDNGMMLGAHGFWGKWYMFEESIRVPLLIRPAKNFWPKLKPKHIKGMALNIDLSPTIMDMATVVTPSTIDGKSLLPLMRGSEQDVREGFFYEFYGMPQILPCIGYRTRDWKFTRYYDNRSQGMFNDCLYDMTKDPQEMNNLADRPEYQSKLAELIDIAQSEKMRMAAEHNVRRNNRKKG